MSDIVQALLDGQPMLLLSPVANRPTRHENQGESAIVHGGGGGGTGDAAADEST